MRISDWSSDVCSSDLQVVLVGAEPVEDVDPVRRRDLKPSDDVGERAVEARSVREIVVIAVAHALAQESFDLAAVEAVEIGRASGRARVCKYVEISVFAVSLTKTT